MLVDGWLGVLTQLVPAAVCWVAVRRVRRRRLEVLLAAGAVTCFAAGSTYYVVAVAAGIELPYPSPADAGYLLCYPLMLAALAVHVRRELRRPITLWLDSALGALGAASALAVLLHPVLRSSLADRLTLTTVTTVSYPLFDLLLVSAVAGIAVTRSGHGSRHWFLLSVGLLVFAIADVAHAFRVAQDSYVVGTPLDAGWSVGLSLIALGVLGLSRSERGEAPAGTATTDDLTGLPNRRALYASVDPRLGELGDLGDPGGDDRQALLLLLDLDRFKEVNDSLGHHVGDRLLIVVGECLRRTLRRQDILARLGGDEFAVLLEDTDQHEAAAVATKLREALAEPFTLEGIALQTSAASASRCSPSTAAT